MARAPPGGATFGAAQFRPPGPRVTFGFTVEGPPVGKGRPRFSKRGRFVKVYTPKETLAAEERIRVAWREAGSQTVEGAFQVVVEAFHGRPDGHYLTDGVSLSAEGRRHPFPENRKPDLDNVLKLVLDALNGHAYKDDVAAVKESCRRSWSRDGERTHIWIGEVRS